MSNVTCRVGQSNSGKNDTNDIKDIKDLSFHRYTAYHISINWLLNKLSNQTENEILFISNLECISLNDIGMNECLHPYEQRDLIEQIKSLDFKGQFIFTTNSPNLVDELEPEQILVFYKGLSAKLSELPEIKIAPLLLTSGEIWGSYGEDWVEKLKNKNKTIVN